MSRLKITGRGFLIAYGAILVLSLIFLLAKVAGPSGPTEQAPIETASDTTSSVDSYLQSGSVNIENSSSLGGSVSKERLASAQNVMYVKIANTLTKPAGQYTGTIRQGTIQKSTLSDGTPTVDFLVDIPTIKRTYHVSINGDDNTEVQSTYVLCPTAQELQYPTFECSDG